MIPSAHGYAYVDPQYGIDVATVSPTRRAALVNVLAVKCGIVVMCGTTDEQIEEAFARQALPGNIQHCLIHAEYAPGPLQ